MRPSGGGKHTHGDACAISGHGRLSRRILTDTRGSGVMNRLFHSWWEPWKGEIPGRCNGALISNDKGQSTAYALWESGGARPDVYRRW